MRVCETPRSQRIYELLWAYNHGEIGRDEAERRLTEIVTTPYHVEGVL